MMNRRRFSGCLLCLLAVSFSANAQDDPQPEESHLRAVRSIFEEALVSGETYQLLNYLCNQIGPRLSGSAEAAQAVGWTRTVMESYEFDRVYLQEVMVPHWERGDAAVARIIGVAEGAIDLRVLAIGGSEPTPAGGISAEVVEVQSLEDVDDLGKAVAGKIVFYNRPFDQRHIRTGVGYGGAVDQRVHGASRAARHGALAIVIRSVTSAFDDAPHTGTLSYEDSLPRIPAAALGVQSADLLSTALKSGNPQVKLHLRMNCRWYEDAPSHNVVGELTGSEFPERFITIGGHLDSWDVGHGAHDDGAGCMQSIMVLRTFQKLGIRPRHTLRAVMFINEENGTAGGKAYAKRAVDEKEDHLIAIESDAGGFTPRGFGVTAHHEVIDRMRSWLPYFDQNTISYIRRGGGGVDIGPLHRALETPMVGLSTDTQRLFDVHHSEHDVFSSVNRRELELGMASMAALVYLVDVYGLE